MAQITPEFQAQQRAEQAALQRQLDAQDAQAGAVQVPRTAGLAQLATPLCGSNVVSFQLAPRPAPVKPGGDAA